LKASKAAAAVYLRVSSRKKDTASQVPDIRQYLEALGLEATWYRDKFAGKTLDRPGFSKLIGEVRAGKVTTVVVWRLDRLGLTARGLTELFEELRSRKVQLVSIRDGLNLATSAGRLTANVLASVAQYEAEARAERIRVGLAAAKARGVRLGRPRGRRTRIKVSDEQIAMIRRLKGEGTGVSAIARATGLSRPTVYGVLAEVA
jgi:DNA invertase Pin-like site-specific DNA recombinase